MRIVKGFTFFIGLVCMIVGVVGLVWVFDTRDVRGGTSASGNIEMTKTAQAASIKKLDVQTDIGAIVFTAADSDEVKAHLTGTVTERDKDNWKLTAETSSDGTWKVEATSGSHFNFGFDFEQLLNMARNGFSHQLVLEVSLPKKELEQISVRTNAGKIDLGDIQTSALYARADTGAIVLNSFKGKELRLETDTGSIEFKNVQATGSVTAHSDTGRVHGSLKELASPVTMDANTGAVTLELPASSQASLEVKTDVGRVSVEAPTVSYDQKERHYVQAKMGAGTYKVHLETDTGSTSLIAR